LKSRWKLFEASIKHVVVKVGEKNLRAWNKF